MHTDRLSLVRIKIQVVSVVDTCLCIWPWFRHLHVIFFLRRPHDGATCYWGPVFYLQQRERAWGEREREPERSTGTGQPPSPDIHAASAARWWEVPWRLGTHWLWPQVNRACLFTMIFSNAYAFFALTALQSLGIAAYLTTAMWESRELNHKECIRFSSLLNQF